MISDVLEKETQKVLEEKVGTLFCFLTKSEQKQLRFSFPAFSLPFQLFFWLQYSRDFTSQKSHFTHLVACGIIGLFKQGLWIRAGLFSLTRSSSSASPSLHSVFLPQPLPPCPLMRRTPTGISAIKFDIMDEK